MPIDYQGNGGGVPRKTAKIFASNAANNDITEFGSTLHNNTTYTTDIADIQNSYYEEGWRQAVISNKNYPLMGDMNGIQKTFSQQIAYLLQHGIGEWDSGTTYYTYDIAKKNGILYISTIDNNTNNDPSLYTGWALYYDPDSLENLATINLDNLSALGEAKLGSNIRGIINDGNLDANGHLDLIDAGTSSDTTYEYSEAGDYTITLASAGNYEVSLIGGGGYGSGSFAYPNPACTAGGGSGAGFIGTITLSAGTYTVTVGGNTRDGNRDTVLKDSSNNIIIKAGGGGNGSASSYSVSATGGAGGVLTNNATVVGSPTLSTNGNAGGRNTSGGGALPGNSVYDNTTTGYGAGGRTSVYAGGAAGYAGVAGYFKLKINSVPSTTIDYKVSQANPLTITDFSGKQTTFYSLNTDLATSLADGTYNKFLDENDSELIANTIYAQLKEPTTPSTNDVWIRTTDKVQAFKYDGADWQTYNKVWLGSVDISSGAASNAVNAELCNNNFNVTTWQLRNYRELVQLYDNGTEGFKVFKEYNPETGAYVGLWCEEWGETGTTNGQRNITFYSGHNPFKTDNSSPVNVYYNASFCWGQQTSFNTTGVVTQNISLVNATGTGFSIKTGVTIPIRWRVSGYLAE